MTASRSCSVGIDVRHLDQGSDSRSRMPPAGDLSVSRRGASSLILVPSHYDERPRVMAKLRFRDAPHPLRECFALLAVSWVATCVLVPFTQGAALRISSFSMGAALVLVGVFLMANFNGAADFYPRFRSERPD